MKIVIPSEFDTPLKEQIEAKLKDEIKAGLLTVDATKCPGGSIRFDPYIPAGDPRISGGVLDAQGNAISVWLVYK